MSRTWRAVRSDIRRRIEDVFVCTVFALGMMIVVPLMIFLARPLGVVALVGLALAAVYLWQ